MKWIGVGVKTLDRQQSRRIMGWGRGGFEKLPLPAERLPGIIKGNRNNMGDTCMSSP